MDVPSGVNRALDLAIELKAHGLVVLDLALGQAYLAPGGNF